jgi:branched-chain amino acid transport system substrate-binding protein
MLASVTTSPALSSMGDYVFRTSPVGVVQSDLLSKLAVNKFGFKKIAILFSQTDYARPIAKRMNDDAVDLGAEVVIYESFVQNTIDFRSILTKVQKANPNMVFISSQNSDEAYQILKQMKELDLNVAIFGNDQIYNLKAFKDSNLNEGALTSGPAFDPKNPQTKEFIEKYKSKYNSDLPFGVWTAESYDAVYILADAIKAVGEDSNKVKDYLYGVKDYAGASGKITIDSNGDGVREYIVRVIKEGELIPFE